MQDEKAHDVGKIATTVDARGRESARHRGSAHVDVREKWMSSLCSSTYTIEAGESRRLCFDEVCERRRRSMKKAEHGHVGNCATPAMRRDGTEAKYCLANMIATEWRGFLVLPL
jgi:hypothetical protein